MSATPTSGQLPDAAFVETMELLLKPYSREQLAQAVRGQLGAASLSVPMAAPAVAQDIVRNTPDRARGRRNPALIRGLRAVFHQK